MLMEFISEINKNNLLYSVIANILAAIVVAFIFFLLKDVFFKFPEFNGRYYLKLIVEETDYNPYREMEMHFLIYFSSSNGELVGGGERIYEDSSRGMKVEHVIHYSGSSKIPIDVSGRIIKRIFGNDTLNAFCKASSKARVSSMVVSFDIPPRCERSDSEIFEGRFSWSVSNKTGTAYLSKNKFYQRPATEFKDEKPSIT